MNFMKLKLELMGGDLFCVMLLLEIIYLGLGIFFCMKYGNI